MTDVRADDAKPLGEERLPWLEAVEEEDTSDGPSAAKLIAAVVIGLVAIGLIVGGLFWMRDRTGGGDPTGAPELIAAPEGDYKVKPDEPGGMKVEGEGDTAFAASEGAEPKGAIDTGGLAEAPITKPAPAPKAAAATPKAPAPAPKAAAPAPKQQQAAATPAPAAGGPAIQLGAFSSQAAANSAWKALSSRFAYLAPLSQSVTAVQSGGKTLYRLRASGPGASGVCGKLRVAGESCVELN